MLHLLTEKPQQLEKLIKRVEKMKTADEDYFDFPFIQDLKGKTPLHILEKNQDNKSMDLVLETLCHFGLDHHSRYILDLWSEIIQSDVPSVVDYLNSRMIDTPYTEMIQEGVMDAEIKHVITEIAFDKEETEKLAFNKTSEEVKIEIENAAAAAASKDDKNAKEEETV